jgi:hypothetical protein
MDPPMKVLLHVHSSYSYDGVPTLGELVAWGEGRGLDLIFVTEHANDFDRSKMERFVRDCDAVSGARCRLVPGLEFPLAGGFHLLGFAVRRFVPSTDPRTVVSFIKEQAGIAVLAHPARYKGAWLPDEAMSELDGIEAWNATYDGRFLPSGAILSSCGRERRRFPHLMLFGGQDLHKLRSGRLITTELPAVDGVEAAVAALRKGQGAFGSGPWRIGARSPLSSGLLHVTGIGHSGYRFLRRVRDRLTRLVARRAP